MSSTQGNTQPGRTDRHRGRADGAHPDAALPQPFSQLQGNTALPYQQRLDGGVARAKLPTQRLCPLPEASDQLAKMGAGLISRAHQFDALADRAGLGGGHMGAVDIVASEVDQILHQLAAAADKGTGNPERLAKSAHLDVYAGRRNPLRRQRATPLGSQHAETVGIVDHQPVAALGGEGCEIAPRALIPVHAEHPLRDDEPAIWFKLPFKGRHIVVGKTLHLARELAAHLLQRGVVEFVLPQQMFLAEQRFEHRLIGRKTAVEQQHRLHPEPLGQGLLKLLVGTAVPGHQRRGAGARAITFNPRVEGGLDGAVIRQSQIVVGGKVEVVAPRNPEPPATRHVGRDAVAQQTHLLALGQSRAQHKGARYCRAVHDRAALARGRVAS